MQAASSSVVATQFNQLARRGVAAATNLLTAQQFSRAAVATPTQPLASPENLDRHRADHELGRSSALIVNILQATPADSQEALCVQVPREHRRIDVWSILHHPLVVDRAVEVQRHQGVLNMTVGRAAEAPT